MSAAAATAPSPQSHTSRLRYEPLHGGRTGVHRHLWTCAERDYVIANPDTQAKVLARGLPGRSVTAVNNCRVKLIREGVVERRKAVGFVRTPELDAEFAVAVVCGATTKRLAARFRRDPGMIRVWKQQLGIQGPRDRAGPRHGH